MGTTGSSPVGRRSKAIISAPRVHIQVWGVGGWGEGGGADIYTVYPHPHPSIIPIIHSVRPIITSHIFKAPPAKPLNTCQKYPFNRMGKESTSKPDYGDTYIPTIDLLPHAPRNSKSRVRLPSYVNTSHDSSPPQYYTKADINRQDAPHYFLILLFPHTLTFLPSPFDPTRPDKHPYPYSHHPYPEG